MKSIPAPMTLMMLLIFSVMVGVASTYPPAARFMPFTVGIPAIALCLLQLAIDLYRRRAPEAADPRGQDPAGRVAESGMRFDVPSENALFAGSTEAPGRVRRELIVWGYFLALIAAVLLFGFYIAVPIFLIAFLHFEASASWRRALIYGCLGALAMFVLFEMILRVSLHSGFITDFVSDRLAT